MTGQGGGFPAMLLVDLLAVALLLGLLALLRGAVVPALIGWLHARTVPTHRFRRADGSEGAGSEDLVYLPMLYDCRDRDVVVRGRAPRCLYWGAGVFDFTLRILEGGHVNHRTAALDPTGRFALRLTVAPRPGEPCLDCRDSPRGLFILRVLLPEGEVELPEVDLEPVRR